MKSKLQLSVLQLYRDFLKFGSRLKDAGKVQAYREKVREEFDEGAKIPRRKFNAIEYKLRTGKNLLKSMQDGQVSGINSVKF